ncbi:unnamed protein product [Trichobilharzia szidati]|nr:unnamed protein product [Trichobilharzia szidati]
MTSKMKQQKLKSQFSPIIYHLKPVLEPVSSPESVETKLFETESETIDDYTDAELKSLTLRTEVSNSPEAVTPTLISCPKIPLTGRSDTLSSNSDIQFLDSYHFSDNNRNTTHRPVVMNSDEDENPDIPIQKFPVPSSLSSKENTNAYKHPNSRNVKSYSEDKIRFKNTSKINANQSRKMEVQTLPSEKSPSERQRIEYHIKSYEIPEEVEEKETQFFRRKPVQKPTGLKFDLKIDMEKSNNGKDKINCYQYIESNSDSNRKVKHPLKQCSMINLSMDSLKNRKLNCSLDSIQQTVKNRDTNDLNSYTVTSDEEEENDEAVKISQDSSDDNNKDQTISTFHSNKHKNQLKRSDFRPKSRRCQSVTGCKTVNQCSTEDEQTNQHLDRSHSQDIICLKSRNKLPQKKLYNRRKATLYKEESDDNVYSQVDPNQHRCGNLSYRTDSFSSQKLQPTKSKSRSSSRVRSSLKVRNKSNERSDCNHTSHNNSNNTNNNNSTHFNHHERRLQSPKNRRTRIGQSPARSKSSYFKGENYNRPIHSPVSYYLDLDDKVDYGRSYTDYQSKFSPVNAGSCDSPINCNSLDASNLHKQNHLSEQQKQGRERNSKDHDLYCKKSQSLRKNLYPIRSKSPCHRQSDISSGSLDRLRKRCRSIERELSSVEREQFGQSLGNPPIGDPRVDALTSANRILRQRLQDIQKLQESREHALNKAHTMVNGLLNKQHKQASIIREGTRDYTQSPPTSYTNNNHHYHENNGTDSVYTAKAYKPLEEDNVSDLPAYTPTKFGRLPENVGSDYYYGREHERKSRNGSGYRSNLLNHRKNLDPRANSTHILLERLRSDYADLANSVYRIEEKARDAASSVQSLLRQFQMGFMDTIVTNPVNQMPSADICEPFDRVPNTNELFDKSVTLRLQKARDTLDQLKSDQVRSSLSHYRQSDFTIPSTATGIVGGTTTSVTSKTNPMMTSSLATSSGMKSSTSNIHNEDEPYAKYYSQYNRPHTNSLRSTWHIS